MSKKFAVMIRIVVAGIFVTLLGCSPLRIPSPLNVSERDWPTFGRNNAHTSYADSAVVIFPMSPAWSYDASAGFGAGAVSVSDGVLFIGTLQGELHAVEAETGKRIGYKKFHSPISGSPVTRQNMLYFGTESGKESFFAYDMIDNETKWSSRLGGIASSPMLSHGKLYVGSLDGCLYCLDSINGKEMWKYESKGAIYSSPVAADSLVIFANDGGTVFALDASNGTQVWKFQTGAAIFGSSMVSGPTVFVGSRDHFLYALEVNNGELRWRYNAGDRIVACPSSNDSLVFVCSLNGTLAALDKGDGKLAWKFKATSAINSSPAVTPTAVIVGSLNTELYALSPLDGKLLWKYKLESRIKTSPIVWKNYVYVPAEDRTVHCFRSYLPQNVRWP